MAVYYTLLPAVAVVFCVLYNLYFTRGPRAEKGMTAQSFTVQEKPAFLWLCVGFEAVVLVVQLALFTVLAPPFDGTEIVIVVIFAAMHLFCGLCILYYFRKQLAVAGDALRCRPMLGKTRRYTFRQVEKAVAKKVYHGRTSSEQLRLHFTDGTTLRLEDSFAGYAYLLDRLNAEGVTIHLTAR